nr:DnaJ domain-containing protein [Candidatus Sigynarchaeum springense]
MSDDDYYKILGVERDASPDEIKRSFREKAKACHPDLHPDDVHAQEYFILLNKAHDILCDARERQAYDDATGKRCSSTTRAREVAARCQKASQPACIVHACGGTRPEVAPVLHLERPFMPGFGTHVESACPVCQGRGFSFNTRSRCPFCDGRGWIEVSRMRSRDW